MDGTTDPPFPAAVSDVSLVRGGPFYRAQQAAKLVQPNQWNLGRRITLLIAVGWLPLLLITVFLNPAGLPSLLADYRVHSRMLIAVPALLLGELLMESRFHAVFSHIRQANLLEASDLAYMDNVIGTLVGVRDSVLPEITILVLLIVHTVTSFRARVDAMPWLAHGAGADLHVTVAGWYGVLVSTTIFQFLLGLGLWKWLLWTFFAFKLSRRNLKLVPTHPDEHGGLGFLGLTPAAFAPVAFALTTVIGASWRHEILHSGAHVMDFRLPAVVLAAIIAIVALGPLLVFVPRLVVLRSRGMLEYGILGQTDGTYFHEKWVLHRVGEGETLQAPEIGALSNFGHIYDKIEQLDPFPADKEDLIALVLAVVIPVLPVVLLEIPLAVVLKDLLRALR